MVSAESLRSSWYTNSSYIHTTGARTNEINTIPKTAKTSRRRIHRTVFDHRVAFLFKVTCLVWTTFLGSWGRRVKYSLGVRSGILSLPVEFRCLDTIREGCYTVCHSPRRLERYRYHSMGPKKKELGEDGTKGPPPKRAKKAKNPTEPTLQDDGFVVCPSELIFRKHPEYKASKKILGLDLDNTLIYRKPGSKGTFLPEDEDDFVIFNDSVKNVLMDYHKKGYGITIFSNQGVIKSAMLGKASGVLRGLVCQVLKQLDGIPINVLLATADPRAGSEYRKPGIKMWKHFVEEINDGIDPDMKDSLYVGDAAGRPSDINNGSDSDKKFAEAIGIQFKTPEDIFGCMAGGRKENDAMGRAFLELANVYLGNYMDIENKFFKAKFVKAAGQQILRYKDVITSSNQLKGVKGIGEGSRKLVDEFLKDGKLAEIEEIRNGTWQGSKAKKEQETVITSKSMSVGQQFL